VLSLASTQIGPTHARTGVPGITVLPNGHHVSRISDWLMYVVEAEYLDKIVAEYGPCASTLRAVFSR
jgi:hypothetical protein